MDHVTSHMIGECQVLYSYKLMFSIWRNERYQSCKSYIVSDSPSHDFYCTYGTFYTKMGLVDFIL